MKFTLLEASVYSVPPHPHSNATRSATVHGHMRPRPMAKNSGLDSEQLTKHPCHRQDSNLKPVVPKATALVKWPSSRWT
ncbi:hypothetical protein CEXT_622741 [Caerostris extrusa]|uniref:Uncharacterized protein n=1 Tax=Caerostris extrusa TaxID=172846 RepID=A0AAV4R7R0_CAEEX|nr:hypothetical protein CEXT_622741 [Caerostris extrusa]